VTEIVTEIGPDLLVLGIGNVLMGDEGVGVEVIRRIREERLPDGVECLDGGTGSFTLLGPLEAARQVILVDATLDGAPAGTIRRLRPRFSKDYPRTLTAHDIGLKDMIDALYLLGGAPDITLFTVSIRTPQDLGVGLSEEVEACVGEVVEAVREEIGRAEVAVSPMAPAFVPCPRVGHSATRPERKLEP
jgi:hydrogenase maturation protease